MELRLILGDQLNHQHSWYEEINDRVIYTMMEMRQETDYTQHHIQKLSAFFLAMRNFAFYLENRGHKVAYLALDNPDNHQNLEDNLNAIIEKNKVVSWSYQMPDEYRLDTQLTDITKHLGLPCKVVDTEHFLTTRTELQDHFKGRKSYVMESFYRKMRKKHQVLMDGDQPVTGQWNYDHNNRKKMSIDTKVPFPKYFERDVTSIVDMIKKASVKYIGNIDVDNFIWPVTRQESLQLLDYFISNLLEKFGDYQDALHPENWTLFHSRLSFSLNSKLLHPMEVIRAVEKAYLNEENDISISQAEGFIRQILGWREYMRGIYWAKMPEFKSLNYFNHDRKLPKWFWNGNTKMKCMSHAITQSLNHSYAHHIQRLMITGNFCLLAGIHPDEVDQWYLGIYIDAIEWVEITNTRGMSQYADGGIVGTKPYVSSANYIDKMGHYCKECHYSKSKKTGTGACPFNAMYWHFYDRHESKLARNPRIGMVYRTWNNMDSEKKQAYLNTANKYIEAIESL